MPGFSNSSFSDNNKVFQGDIARLSIIVLPSIMARRWQQASFFIKSVPDIGLILNFKIAAWDLLSVMHIIGNHVDSQSDEIRVMRSERRGCKQ